jgi:nicotinate phosphoribosyltransferase
VTEGRTRFRLDLSTLPESAVRIHDPEPVVPVISGELAELTRQVRARLTAEAVPTGRYQGRLV